MCITAKSPEDSDVARQYFLVGGKDLDSKMATRLQGAVKQLLKSYKETIHEPNPNSERKRLLAAVDGDDIVALKEMRSEGTFSNEEIIKAAIDKDNVRVVEEFKEEIQNVDEVDGLGPLLDYSIEKRAMHVTRKLREAII